MNELIDFLKNKCMSQATFAHELNVSQTLIHQWISGSRPINIERALDIEEKFGINAEKLNPKFKSLFDRIAKRSQTNVI